MFRSLSLALCFMFGSISLGGARSQRKPMRKCTRTFCRGRGRRGCSQVSPWKAPPCVRTWMTTPPCTARSWREPRHRDDDRTRAYGRRQTDCAAEPVLGQGTRQQWDPLGGATRAKGMPGGTASGHQHSANGMVRTVFRESANALDRSGDIGRWLCRAEDRDRHEAFRSRSRLRERQLACPPSCRYAVTDATLRRP
jgi:hypothetical protein